MRNIILILFFTTIIYGQNSKYNSDAELCGQIDSAVNYLKNDIDLGVKNFRFDSTIENGSLYEFYFSTEYVAYELGIEKEKLFEYDKTKTYPIYKKLAEIEYQISELRLDCLKKRRKPNAKLSKIDKDSLVINITTNSVGKEGSSGIAFIFFFENGKITKVYRKGWIS